MALVLFPFSFGEVLAASGGERTEIEKMAALDAYAEQGGLVMQYTKPLLLIDQQIDLLISRGMEVDNRVRAVRYLNHINYYRFRAYWLPFEEKSAETEHQFKLGTTFDDALKLYLFDIKFRLLIMEAIERAEISLRTRFAQELALKYGSHADLDGELHGALLVGEPQAFDRLGVDDRWCLGSAQTMFY